MSTVYIYIYYIYICTVTTFKYVEGGPSIKYQFVYLDVVTVWWSCPDPPGMQFIRHCWKSQWITCSQQPLAVSSHLQPLALEQMAASGCNSTVISKWINIRTDEGPIEHRPIYPRINGIYTLSYRPIHPRTNGMYNNLFPHFNLIRRSAPRYFLVCGLAQVKCLSQGSPLKHDGRRKTRKRKKRAKGFQGFLYGTSGGRNSKGSSPGPPGRKKRKN